MYICMYVCIHFQMHILSLVTKKRHDITSGFSCFPDYDNMYEIKAGVQVHREFYAMYYKYIREF